MTNVTDIIESGEHSLCRTYKTQALRLGIEKGGVTICPIAYLPSHQPFIGKRVKENNPQETSTCNAGKRNSIFLTTITHIRFAEPLYLSG